MHSVDDLSSQTLCEKNPILTSETAGFGKDTLKAVYFQRTASLSGLSPSLYTETRAIGLGLKPFFQTVGLQDQSTLFILSRVHGGHSNMGPGIASDKSLQ